VRKPPKALPLVGTLPDRALWRVTTFTSRLGERHGIDWLTYNPLQLLAYHRLAAPQAPAVIRAFARVFPTARTYIDVGAGSGAYAAEAKRQGIDVIACEHARSGRLLARVKGVDSRPVDLTRDPPVRLSGMVDLAYSIEVAEHLPAALGDRLVHALVQLAPTIIFTAAQPGQGGLGHVNEQFPDYWIERFERLGSRYDEARTQKLLEAFAAEGVTASWLLRNAMVFRRASSRLCVGEPRTVD
jgi:hypothetical protein